MASTCLEYSWKVVHGTVKQEILRMRRQCNWCLTCPLFISNHTKVKRRQRICTNAPVTCTPFEQVQEKGIRLWLPLIWKLANTTVNFGRKEGRRACCRPVIKIKIRSVVEEWCVLRLYKKKNYLFYVINVFPVHKSHCCDLCFARLILILLDDTRTAAAVKNWN